MRTLSRRHFMLQSAAATGLSSAAFATSPLERHLQSKAAAGAPLEAGAAMLDLTPPAGIPMWGYSDPDQISTGTRDPLMARAVALRVGDTAIALISMDFGRMPISSICDAVRENVAAAGVDDVIFCATHTHSGPIMELPELPHLPGMATALSDLVKEAAGRLEPVRAGIGTAALDIAHNRRVVENGQCWMRWRNLERLPSGPLDQELTAIRLESLAGRPVATLVHYACHPVIFASDNTEYSADWCGAMCREVQAETKAPCLFIQGAAGDINPYFDKMALHEGAVEAVAGEGHKAATAVFGALQAVQWLAPDVNGLALARNRVDVGLRYDYQNAEQVAILREAYGLLYDFYMAGLGASLPLAVDTLLLQGQLAMTFQPGEPFVQFQLDFKTRATVPHSLLCGYANDFHIYFPTIEAAIIGGYGASSATYAGIGAGERLLAESLAHVGHLTGRLGPLRGVEDLQSQDWEPQRERGGLS